MTSVEIAHRLAQQAERVCEHLLPNGRRKKRDWCIGGVGGQEGQSLHVVLEGNKAGVWLDRADRDQRGNMLHLWCATRGVDMETACDEAMEWLNIPEDERRKNCVVPRRIENPAPDVREPSKTWLRLQKHLRPGTVAELSALATLRRLPCLAGLQLASDAGQLFFADVFDDGFDWPAWIITDGERRNAQARRMDGKIWDGIEAKAKTIAGSEAKWPVGIAEAARSFSNGIALVEGGPDFLAAWHFIWSTGRTKEIMPVAMFGAAQSIHPEALPLFAGKDVWIFPHADDAGRKGAEAWRTQLHQAGANSVDFFDFTPDGVKDLNELVEVELAEEAKEESNA